MAKKTRTELSTLALNTNLPDNTTEQITPTTERSQLTDERESVVNYKDDLGGATNAGKFLTVATDGESLTMVDEPSGVPDWVTFLSRSMRLFTSDVSSNATIEWTYLNALDVLTIGAAIDFSESSKYLQIKNEFSGETMTMTGGDIIFQLVADQLFKIKSLEITHYGDDFNMIAQDVFGASPLYNLNFKGRIDSSSNRFTFSSISGGKENVTEDDKAGFLSFKTGIADGTLTERLRISSGGVATFSNRITATKMITSGFGGSENGALCLRGAAGANEANLINFGYDGANYQPAYIGYLCTSGAANTNGALIFATRGVTTDTAPTERLRISSGGDIFMGGISADPSNTVFGSAFVVDTAGRMVLKQSLNRSTVGAIQEYYSTSGAAGQILVTGNTTNFSGTSDYRLKENVTPITDALSRVNQLKPSRFNFIADTNTIIDGFLAHEVQDIVPIAVSGKKDAMKDEEFVLTPMVEAVTDEEGNVITEAVEAVMQTRTVPDYQGIDQSKIVPLLTAAIQEQQTIIDSLINRLEALEA
jgi:hypothetical protein